VNIVRQVPRIAAAIAMLAASPGLVQAATTILPGFWESKNHSELLITQDSTDKKCITPAQVESYLSGRSVTASSSWPGSAWTRAA
jgi:hypothetical protein